MTTIKRKRKRKPGWYLLVSLVFVIALYFFYNSCRNIKEIVRLIRMKHHEEKVLLEAQKKKNALQREKERLLNDSTYIEEIARREYGMIRKGEEIFQISLPDSEKTEKNNAR